MDYNTVIDELENWEQWANSGHRELISEPALASIYRMGKQDESDDNEGPRERPKPPIRHRDAEMVDLAIEMLSEWHKAVLKHLYIYTCVIDPRHMIRIQRLGGIGARRFHTEFDCAVMALGDVLDKLALRSA